MSIVFLVLVNEKEEQSRAMGMFTLHKVPWYSLEVTEILGCCCL